MSNLHSADVAITINGVERTLSVRHHWSLLDVLRDVPGLTGAKRGCDHGECGSGTVLLEGLPVNACQALALRVAGRSVLTVESLAPAGELSTLQQAFLDEDGGQRGFCTPDFVMAARVLLDGNPSPTERRDTGSAVGQPGSVQRLRAHIGVGVGRRATGRLV